MFWEEDFLHPAAVGKMSYMDWSLVFVLFFLEIILLNKHFSDGFSVLYDSYAAMMCWALKKTENNGRVQQCPHESHQIRVLNYRYASTVSIK